MTFTRTPVVAAALLATLAAGLAGCSKGGGDLSPEETLAAAKTRLDSAKGVHLLLAADRLPTGVSGLVQADGVGTHAPAFKGTIKVAASGVTADAKVIATRGAVYAVLPFTSKYVQIDPKDYGAPDPAALMSADGGLSSLLTDAKDVTEGKRQREGAQVLSTYSATVSGRQVAAIIPSAAAGQDFDATFQVSDDHTLHRAVLTGPFYPKGGDVTYTITFDHYGTAPQISAP
jgi:lipoprotein LprG